MKSGGLSLYPQPISRFWLCRLLETALFACITIVVLYIWARFIPTGYSLPIGMSITDISAAVAAIGSIITISIRFWLPQNHSSVIATIVYIIAAAVAGVLITSSGGANSPFFAVWIIVAIFAGFFGLAMVSLISALVVMQAIISYVQTPSSIQLLIGNLFLGLLPIIFGVILWGRRQTTKKNIYSDLEQKLSNVEGKSDVVINTIDDGVLAISREGNIELINPSAQNLIGWNQGDALGLNWKSVLKLATSDGKEVAEIDNPIAQSLTKNQPTHSDKLFLVTSSDKRRLVSIVSSPVGTNNQGVIVVFRDITKEKAEEREQAEFISTASHEMRTPVASIEGYLGLALNPATAQIDEKARDFITKAHESAQHLGRLFQDLLDISKAEDGRLKNEPQIINVEDFVRDIWSNLAPKANEKQLQYSFLPDVNKNSKGERQIRPVFYANVDPDHLREVIDNLIENAIKYTPSGEVAIDVSGDDSHISISVKDSGIGIPAEDIPHLFQKFYRVDNSDTREIGGTGLGLYLCRRLAENMSGSLRVESEYKKGSTFFLDLPRTSADEASRKVSSTSTTEDLVNLDKEDQAAVSPIENITNNIETTPAPAPTSPIPDPQITPEQITALPPQNQSSTPTVTEIDNKVIKPQRDQLSIPERKS